nr:hypothetical protein CJLB15_00107 [Campylobacter phage CJLB-15]
MVYYLYIILLLMCLKDILFVLKLSIIRIMLLKNIYIVNLVRNN